MSSSQKMIVELENNSSISPWPDLPKELLSMIKNFLNSPTDVARFRSVCASWRSSTAPFKTSFPVSAVPFKDAMFPMDSEVHHLTEKVIFCIEPLRQSSSSSSSWLISVEFDGCKIYLVNPFTGLRIESLHSQMPKQLNMCDYRFTELKKVYSVQDFRLFSDGAKQCIIKKALFVSPPNYDHEMLVVLVPPGNLVFYKLGTDQWITLREIVGMGFDDIILHHGRVYGITSLGITVVVYSDLSPKEIANRVLPEGMCCMAYLIESCGHIYLIERYEDTRKFDPILSGFNHVISRWTRLLDDGVFQVKVYRLLEDEEMWKEVSHLDNRVFFLSCFSNWSFSASSEDFLGCKGNCIIFEIGSGMIDENSYELPSNAGVFDVETGNLQVLDQCPGYAEMYWPPPNWLNPQNLSG
ncbi:hypothetical protein LIER_17962 [Lithospermum erythrorhizon]|uniref:F-box domain-containing protein n=1 Tax=Lithospermum erythrorhizon TaxID=34254 RepID=A0AAV3QDB5_LITER